MILDMEGILMGGGRADKGINKNQKNIDLKAHIETYSSKLQSNLCTMKKKHVFCITMKRKLHKFFYCQQFVKIWFNI